MWGTWRPNGPRPVLCQIYFIRDWVVLVLCLELDIVPEKPYIDPDSDLEVTWAQRRSTTIICFDYCEVLATFRQKFLKQNK